MEKYMKRAFHSKRAQVIYDRYTTPFALVMRSTLMVCIDIDGKNNGSHGAKGLMLPPTLAETSKSGNGWHLFYTVDDTWDARLGFAMLRDKIGLVPGVDFRAVGCVFHYPRQQWNTRKPARLPEHILDKLRESTQKLEHSITQIQQTLDSEDEMEILMMQEHVSSRLTAPIPAGKRNNTLFAIGAEMSAAHIPGWQQQILDRGVEVGLPLEEVEKIVRNIQNYA
jgi:hypothetical protein